MCLCLLAFLLVCSGLQFLGTTVCIDTGWSNQGHAFCRMSSLRRMFFLVAHKFNGADRIMTTLRGICLPSIIGILPDLKCWTLIGN